MAARALLPLLVLHFFFFFFSAAEAQKPGFVSINCGGADQFTDNIGLEWTPDTKFPFGERANVSVPNQKQKQFTTVRYFPADDRKYCYTFNVTIRTRYLVRASFLYGNFDNSSVYPRFDISLGATPWTTIVIYDANSLMVKEMVLLAYSTTISVCLSNATAGLPFISTLEVRQFNGSLYYTPYETQFFLGLGARINFGAPSNDSVRYPDDPYDRIWESDSLSIPNYLVDVAPGTKKVSTTKPIYIDIYERPPQKVMQTAVVGEEGYLNYRIDLDGFPAFALVLAYLAEIEEYPANETRKFKLYVPGYPALSEPTYNIQQNAPGRYRVYEPGVYNISLPFVLSFGLNKTADSTKGPILNAAEILKYLEINYGSLDATPMTSFTSHYPQADWAQEGGDPCLPAPWTWVQCNVDPQPRVVSINLPRKNLTGSIPVELTNLTGLILLQLASNSLTGSIPDFSGCLSLKYIHLENNELNGEFPSWLADLPSLQELYVQNNNLSGVIPSRLLNKNIIFNYSGNYYLRKESKGSNFTVIIVCSIIGGTLLLVAAIAYYLFTKKKRKTALKAHALAAKHSSILSDPLCAIEDAHRYPLSEIEDATGQYEKRIGSGGFGVVYYGKLADGKEIAVKVLRNESTEGMQEFLNEVNILSKIHHRNLVTFLGYSQDDKKNILVYDFMHKGTLKEHLHGPDNARLGSWIVRLEIAEDAAKGIEYLHTGCSPTIIHRDLKTSNILLDKHMTAKVSDFGLSKPVEESHVSSAVRGTVGYLDPEYYTYHRLTTKSDIYSFGIILLELISGHEPISAEHFGPDSPYIVDWARTHIQSGNIQAIVDPSLKDDYDVQSVWKVADVAIMCVKPDGIDRPTISEVLREIQEAISIEKRREYTTESLSNKSPVSSDLVEPGAR